MWELIEATVLFIGVVVFAWWAFKKIGELR